MNKNSIIFVSGHRGMVGSAIKRCLESRGYKNILTRSHSELDLISQLHVEEFFDKERPDYVFLAAARVGGILANDTYKANFIYDNLMIAANVINASYKNGTRKLINLGSSCIYPKFAPQPLKEDSLLTGSLEPTNEPYAIAKIAALKLCRYYNEQYGTDYISIMPTNLYGFFDNYNLEQSHVLPALIRKFHLAKLLMDKKYDLIKKDIKHYTLGYDLDDELILDSDISIISILRKFGITDKYVMLWGSGEVYREFMHADDLADACIYLMNKYGQKELGEFVNVGTGKDIMIKDLALLVRKVVGYDGEIKHDQTKPDGTPRKLLDISRIKNLGWQAKISLEEGVKRTYDWYCGAYK